MSSQHSQYPQTLPRNPALQWKFAEHWVAAAGVLFTAAGQNAIDSIYPNISVYWYWSRSGKVIMR